MIEVTRPPPLVIGGICTLVAGLVSYIVGWFQGSALNAQSAQVVAQRGRAPPTVDATKPISIRGSISTWTKPIGEVIYFHQWIDRELIDLIWLMEAREEALRLGHWATRRSDPPSMQGGNRIRRFAKLARAGFAAFASFVDFEARTTIDRLIADLYEANSFRNTLVHGRWGGHSNSQLFLFQTTLPGNNKWILVTPEALEARGRKAFELIQRLRKFHLWVQEQNAEVTRHQQQRAIIPIIRLLRMRAEAGSASEHRA